MDVFISWSGSGSRDVAQSLRSWLPAVLQHITPWLSDKDIEPGSRWAQNLSDRLERTHVGIICLTNENRESPWIIYEAGALSKSVTASRVIPYLIDVEPNSLRGPLSAFQAVRANKAGTWELIECLHKSIEGQALSVVRSVFEAMWPQFEVELLTAGWRMAPQNIGLRVRTWGIRGTVLRKGQPVNDAKVKLDVTTFYFAHPYASWERGLNENTNGLVRQYFPKKSDFSKITDRQIKKVVERLNHRPRKTLGYKTPNEVFFKQPLVALTT